MTNPAIRIYLASRSPRRRELLQRLGVGFDDLLAQEKHGADVDETPLAGEAPDAYVMRLARAKAALGWRQVVARKLTAHPVLAADTTVVLDGEIIGKPDDAEHARQLLRRLAGKTHQVLTAVAVARQGRVEAALSSSKVEFRQLDDATVACQLPVHRRYPAVRRPWRTLSIRRRDRDHGHSRARSANRHSLCSGSD